MSYKSWLSLPTTDRDWRKHGFICVLKCQHSYHTQCIAESWRLRPVNEFRIETAMEKRPCPSCRAGHRKNEMQFMKYV